MSDDPMQLSLKLCSVLERIGVCDSMRKMYHDISMTGEIIWTLLSTDISVHYFGSSIEGTTTAGLGSDIDQVVCHEYIRVMEDIREVTGTENLCLMVRDRDTQPGYVKLQKIVHGTPLTVFNCNAVSAESMYDCKGRVCMKHLTRQGVINVVNERNGPADTVSGNPNVVPLDVVHALRCNTFPHIASESLNKCTACGWISEIDVERMKGIGILLVGVGFQTSEERDIEWRVSFSFQERQLMLALNSTQHKCYLLLKIIKNIITAKPDVGKSLTSYHCKTCLFSAITDTGMALWTAENLVKCTFICLSKMLEWISRGYCPNFFIIDNNMFERRTFVLARRNLLDHMQHMLGEWPAVLYNIESDHIGKALLGRASTLDDNRTRQVYDVLTRICKDNTRYQYETFLLSQELSSYQQVTGHLFKQLCYLTVVDTITEHTQEQTHMVVRQLEPILHKMYVQQLASVAFSTGDPAFRSRLLDASTHHLRLAKTCDIMSSDLLEATILYKTGRVNVCCRLLEHVESSIKYGAPVSFCLCYPFCKTRNEYILRNVASGNINQHNIVEFVAPCVMFLPSQAAIIPKALQYEMYRSVGAHPETRNKPYDKWYNMAVVDSKIYLFFLQYLVYSDLNNAVAKQIAIDHIWKIMGYDCNLGHIETAYNLLGWIYTREGRFQEALECLRFSWTLRPDHNAAKWHVLQICMRLRGHH